MKPYLLAVIYLLVVILVAHFVAPEAYDWTVNTISELAAQGYARAWIMRLGFVGFGLLVFSGGLLRMRRSAAFRYRELPVMLYGLAILGSGLFSTAPFLEGVPYSETEARLHSIFATLAGISLSLGILLFALTDRPASRQRVHALALVLTLLISLWFGAQPAYTGIVQRLLYLTGFAWLVFLDFAHAEKL